MIREAINRILELAEPNITEVSGEQYTDKPLTRMKKELTASPLEVHSLSAILDYIVSGADECAQDVSRRFVLHVADYNSVQLYTELNGDKARECLLQSTCSAACFPFGRFMDVETFIINLQANFVPDDMVRALMQMVGTVTDGNSVTLADDGITQKATAKTGISLVKQVNVPNPVTLAPFRTFSEIAQPQSRFVFRVRGENGVSAALFAADGDAWKHDAIIAIRDYFADKLPQELREEVIVLA